MARHAATARSTSPGKGKKAGVTVSLTTARASRAKSKRAAKSTRAPRRAAASAVRHLDTIVRVGTAITFAPTGERLRVAKIEDGQITFEKLP
jgi:hypothetical protein